jgi:hypothetical protein
MPRHGRSLVVCALLSVLWPVAAAAQSDVQVWGELNLSWIKSHDLTLRLDVEPKVLASKPPSDPGWGTIDLTPAVEFTHGRRIDVVGELLVARTWQTGDLRTTEITPRIGLRLHLLSNLKNDLLKERQPKHRLVLRELIRMEWRNLSYSNSEPSSSTGRLRARVEGLYPFNRPRLTVDGALYVTSDAEWFWTTRDPEERYATKQRVRAGLGYRHSYRWRYEGLVVWDRSRHADTGYTLSDYAIDLHVQHVW